MLSDVHANLEALEACLDHARARGADRFAFLGDLVGYGADAGAVVDLVMRHVEGGALAVKGNHDEAAAQGAPSYMNDSAREAIEWAQRSLGPAQKAFLAGLPLCLRDSGLCLAHASADSPERWSYVDSPVAAARSMQAAHASYTFSGHVHDQLLYAEVGAGKTTRYRPLAGSPIPLGRHRRWLGLVGSVGQPRDGHPSAAYALFDSVREALTYFRVAYDCAAAAKKIRAAGLSESLAYRVEHGV